MKKKNIYFQMVQEVQVVEELIVIHLVAGVIGNTMDQEDGFKTPGRTHNGKKIAVNIKAINTLFYFFKLTVDEK